MSGYSEHEEMLYEVLACDPAAGGYDRRDEDKQCLLCGRPTVLMLHHKHWGPSPLCAGCWDPVVHGPTPDADR